MISFKQFSKVALGFVVLFSLEGTIASDQPYTLESPAADADGKLSVLVYHDMEGLAGQDDWRTFLYAKKEFYPKGQEYLINDINAVVDGLFAGGADEVHIVDAHGSGNPSPDVLFEKLDPRAKQVFRKQPFHPYVDLVEPGVYDICGGSGFACRVWCS